METQPRIPRLAGRPWLGNHTEFRTDRLNLLRRLPLECGDAGELRMGPLPILALSSSELAQAVLVEHASDFVKSRGLRMARSLVGNGLLTSEHEFHRRQRTLVAPGFRAGRIAAYADSMVARAERAQRAWRDGETIDVSEEMMRLTLAIVAETLFGADVDRDARTVAESLSLSSTSPMPFRGR